MGTGFIENENKDVSKNDCGTEAFKRLAGKLKKEYPCMKICVLADSLYASEPVFEKCIKDNKRHFLIRYKDGSIPSAAEEYRSNVILMLQQGEAGVSSTEKSGLKLAFP